MPFFQICGVPFRIVTGVYLCLSVLAGYGASVLLNGKYFIFKKIPKPRNIFFIMLILILILIEAIDNYPVLKEPNLEFFRVNCQKLFYQQISKNNENYAILDLPIEGSLDRIYMLYQIYHEKKISCACLRRSLLNTYDFLEFIPLLAKVRRHENYNGDNSTLSQEEISLNHKQLKNTNIKFVILHKILSESSNHKNEHTFSEYQIIIEKYQPIKKIVFNECIAYQFW